MSAHYDLPAAAPLTFAHFSFTGDDAAKFLQGQVTVNVDTLTDHYQATAICDLKGRIQFGLWLKRCGSNQFEMVIAQDLADDFAQHIKKYGAFSKAVLTDLSQDQPIYPALIELQPTFTEDAALQADINFWKKEAIDLGEAWITKATAHLFQPQELRLHQRGGVDYDKGCYLGQEIIARLWFKAKPKHWLHLIHGEADCPQPPELLNDDVQVVNSVSASDGQWWALVVAKPEALVDLNVTVLDLPHSLNGSVAREA